MITGGRYGRCELKYSCIPASATIREVKAMIYEDVGDVELLRGSLEMAGTSWSCTAIKIWRTAEDSESGGPKGQWWA